MSEDPNKVIADLVDRWCERRELAALAKLLPAWLGNNGLTDGWANLKDAIRQIDAMQDLLPADERDSLQKAYVAIDSAIRHR